MLRSDSPPPQSPGSISPRAGGGGLLVTYVGLGYTRTLRMTLRGWGASQPGGPLAHCTRRRIGNSRFLILLDPLLASKAVGMGCFKGARR